MASIIIPFSLRQHSDGRRAVQVQGPTLQAALANLLEIHPRLAIIHDQPELLSLFINARPVPAGREGWGAIRVGEGDEISLIIPIAGG